MEEKDPKIQTADLYKIYQQKIAEELTLDEISLKDKQMALPACRHYWVGRLMHHKQEIVRLKKLRGSAAKKLRTKLQSESPVGLSSKTAKDAIESHDVMIQIDDEIAQHELLVDYLQRVETNLRSTGFDIKNLVEIIKLETT